MNEQQEKDEKFIKDLTEITDAYTKKSDRLFNLFVAGQVILFVIYLLLQYNSI